MMNRMRRIAVLAMTVCLILGTMAVRVYADDYPYKLTVSPGNGSGSTATAEKSIKIDQNADFTGTVTIDEGESFTVSPPDENHFVTGMKEAGRDNETTKLGTVTVKDKDVEYVVTYGLKSNMVSYTVTYAEAGGYSLDLTPSTESSVKSLK